MSHVTAAASLLIVPEAAACCGCRTGSASSAGLRTVMEYMVSGAGSVDDESARGSTGDGESGGDDARHSMSVWEVVQCECECERERERECVTSSGQEHARVSVCCGRCRWSFTMAGRQLSNTVFVRVRCVVKNSENAIVAYSASSDVYSLCIIGMCMCVVTLRSHVSGSV